jgi:uncharacterized protein YbbC (DUF1343 family)
MRIALTLAASLFLVGCASPQKTKLGIDVLRDEHFAILQGKRVGAIVNPASVDQNLKPTVLVLKDAPNVNLVALYGPEHGVWGDEYAGDKVDDKIDPQTGLRAYSLYGKNRKPTTQMLNEVDTFVFDLQDIGARSYTNINTMKNVLLACAESDKELVILDRPNPLGGERVEGGPVVSEKYRSGVSSLDVPYLHGMTMGELALMTRDKLVPKFKKLHVVKMSGWHRDMTWADTHLEWVPTSPHVPHVSTVAAYSATGILGELYQISNGVGYTQPFEIVGSPDIDGVALAEKMNKVWPNEPGVYFRAMRFKPFYATQVGKLCGGVQVHLDPHTAPSLVEINYRLIEAIDGPGLMKIAATPTTLPTFGDAGDAGPRTTQPATTPAATRATTAPTSTRKLSFDKVTGSDEAGNLLLKGEDLAPLFARWRAYCDSFKQERAKYLLYR